jgi:hypothetical protein
MKTTILTVCFALMIPFAGLAQNAGTSKDQLQKELDQFKTQMKEQVKALQDSIALLRDQLAKERRAPVPFEFELREEGDFFEVIPDMNWDHSFNFEFNWPDNLKLMIPPAPEISPVPPGGFYFRMPEDDYFFESRPFEFHYQLPPVPDIQMSPQHQYEKKKKDDFLRMLPFYDWFKS